MILQPCDVAVIKGSPFQPMDWIIYQRTSTWWGHCVVIKDAEGNCFDPRLGGIKDHNLERYSSRDVVVRRYKGEIDREKLMAWCLDKQANAHVYDLLAILGFLTGIKAFEDDDSWYCSELPYWMFQENGYKLTEEEMSFIYPCFFMQSNDFETVDEIKGIKPEYAPIMVVQP